MQSTVVWFTLWMLWCILMLPAVYSKEAIINDANMSVWFLQSFQPVTSGANWFKKDTLVETCGTGDQAEFWVITQHVSLDSVISEHGSEIIIYVDVEAELNWCPYPSNKNIPGPCFKNYFEVYIYSGVLNDTRKKSLETAPLNDFLDIFSPLHNITNNTSPTATLIKSTETFFFDLKNKSDTVTFAVRSRGACGKIYRMKMYFFYCGETFIHGIKFENTTSPSKGFNKRVAGNCSENAKRSNNTATFIGFCHDNGTWTLPAGGNKSCFCIAGYTLSNKSGSCSSCSVNKYKKDISNAECARCPDNTISSKSRTGCECEKNHYRVSYDKSDFSACYALPGLNNKPTVLLYENRVNISWTKPNNSMNDTILYDVKCYNCTHSNMSCSTSRLNKCNLTKTWVVLSNLEDAECYVFRVYAKNKLNRQVDREKWNYIETDHINVTNGQTKKPDTPEDSKDDYSSLYIIIGAVCVLLIIIIFILVCLVRSRKNRQNKSASGYINRGVELPQVGRRLYVDPSNYDDPQAALVEFTNELDSKLVFLERLIGGGEFGDVYKGVLTTNDKKKVPIAAKTLKHDANEKSKRDFTVEASVMGQFDNPNIVRLEGVITKSTPRMIILEYMSNGSLDNYLKSNDSMLTDLQLIGMARGVAAGMKYLAEINFVHRDLAARNILVNDDLLCKIADFGLSRELEMKETSRAEYSTQGGKIPVRWTAPEAINLRKFSSASDVWSFGIVLWEIMSYAERPYWGWDNFKVLEELDRGYRLPPPNNCPKGVHELMLHCWKADRSERPSFVKITVVIDHWIRSPETLDEEITSLTPIGEWLASLKMSSYETKFVDAGYKRKSQVIDLTDKDLKEIGVTLVGHRNKIKKGIDSLNSIKSRESLII